jgi:HTH-type transcriptional regulator, cell division transcriptional repressor
MSVLKQNIVGPRVREARLKHKPPLTQDELSARLARHGVTIDRAGISKIESGTRRVADFELKAFVKALKVSSASLLGGW